MFVHNDVTSDGRVLREATSLAAHGWQVTVVGVVLGGQDRPDKETISKFTILRAKPSLFRNIPGTLGKLLRLVAVLPKIASLLRGTNARVYHANDFVGLLVVALSGIWRRPVVYDAHELFFDRFPEGLFTYPLKYVIWALRPLEKILARRAAAVMTVGDGVADRLAETLNIPRPIVVRNAVDLRLLEPPVALERRDGDQIIAHSGVVTNGRNLPELVNVLPLLPGHIRLALIGDGRLRPQLVEQAGKLGIGDRLLTVFPVNPSNIVTTLAQADAAIMLITSNRLSYHLSLPNKFFEAVAAGLPIVSSAIPEVVHFIQEYDIGEVCDVTKPSSVAQAILEVLKPDNYVRYQENILKARSVLNWEQEEKKVIQLYESLLVIPNSEVAI